MKNATEKYIDENNEKCDLKWINDSSQKTHTILSIHHHATDLPIWSIFWKKAEKVEDQKVSIEVYHQTQDHELV